MRLYPWNPYLIYSYPYSNLYLNDPFISHDPWNHLLFINQVQVTYYPMCGGEEIPAAYEPLSLESLKLVNEALKVMLILSNVGALDKVYNDNELRIAINQSPAFRSAQHRENFKQRLDKSLPLIRKMITEVMDITRYFRPDISNGQVFDQLGTVTIERINQMMTNLEAVRGVEEAHRATVERHLVKECGILIATLNGRYVASIWVFSDPRMVSNNQEIRYIFAQGIRGSVPYLLSRIVAPKKVNQVSNIIIPMVEEWAKQHGANAVRINPTEALYSILINRFGYQDLTEEDLKGYSTYLQDVELVTRMTDLPMNIFFPVIKKW